MGAFCITGFCFVGPSHLPVASVICQQFGMDALSAETLELVNEFLGEPDQLEDHTGSQAGENRFKQAWLDVWAWLGASNSLQAHYCRRWKSYFGDNVSWSSPEA